MNVGTLDEPLEPTLWLEAEEIFNQRNDPETYPDLISCDGVDLATLLGYWPDLSSNTWMDLNQSDQWPVLRTDDNFAMNGHPVVYFEPTKANVFNGGSLTMDALIKDTEHTIFLVLYIKAVTGNDPTPELNNIILIDDNNLFIIYLKNAPTMHIFSEDGSSATCGTTATTLENHIITTSQEDGGDITIKKNNGNTAILASASCSTLTDLTGGLHIGYNGGGDNADMYLAAVIMFNKLLSADQQKLVCDYLRTKFALY